MALPVSAERTNKRGVGGQATAALVALALDFASLHGVAPAAMAVTGGISAIERLPHDGDSVTIRFKNPIPVYQGILGWASR